MISQDYRYLPFILDSTFLKGVREDTATLILEKGAVNQLAKNDILFLQGQAASKCYMLVNGHVKLNLSNSNGDQVSVQHLIPGDAFALLGAFQHSRYPLTALALDVSEVVFWASSELEKLCRADDRLHSNCTKIMTDRSLEFQQRILEMSSENVEKRIARSLLRLAQHLGIKNDAGVVLDCHLTRQDIADLSGTTLYSASRILSRFEKKGVLGKLNKRILIKDIHGLAVFADDLVGKYQGLTD